MYNYIMLVGNIVDINQEEKKFKIKVNKPFKNVKGEIESEIFTINVVDFLLDTIKKNGNINATIGVKGRVQLQNNQVELVADRIIFF